MSGYGSAVDKIATPYGFATASRYSMRVKPVHAVVKRGDDWYMRCTSGAATLRYEKGLGAAVTCRACRRLLHDQEAERP